MRLILKSIFIFFLTLHTEAREVVKAKKVNHLMYTQHSKVAGVMGDRLFKVDTTVKDQSGLFIPILDQSSDPFVRYWVKKDEVNILKNFNDEVHSSTAALFLGKCSLESPNGLNLKNVILKRLFLKTKKKKSYL